MAAILVALAVALKVLIPAGYMVGAAQAGEPGFVICTGQGAMVMQADGRLAPARDGKSKPAESRHDAPCTFAGHGAPPLAASPASEVVSFAGEPTVVVLAAETPATPGRGLSAPPPPSHAPPIA